MGALWGKSAERAGGRKNLLLSHLLDTAAVAERMWDGFLAPSTRLVLDDIAGGPGKGRGFFAWLCGVHDYGKATPAFQRMWPEGAEAVRKAGLTWSDHLISRKPWRHDRAGAHLLCRDLSEAGWTEERIDWLWPLVAGHHGRFPSRRDIKPTSRAKGHLVGLGPWPVAQRALLTRFTAELGFEDVATPAPAGMPNRAVQLHLSGLIVMADWIASDEKHFGGVDDLRAVTFEAARGRAEKAWSALGMHRGWGSRAPVEPEAFQDRFGQAPRPSQTMVVEAARRMTVPGLLVVEAPMGEGKTKAALLAAEILAARFGADGVFVGMPTQATSDPMFGQVREWLGGIDEELPSRVALLHGKRMFNPEWRALVEGSEESDASRFGGVDEYGECPEDDPYGFGPEDRGDGTPSSSPGAGARGPAEWFLGAKRGLLCPFVVGTIDQLLLAATRTKHVMLRMAGLMGKVVVLDEVHAADVYMSQFLMEGLRWLGQAGVPVVLLSATLPPRQRQDLVSSYLAGALSREEYTADGLPEPGGYPSVTAAWPSARPEGTRGTEEVPEPRYLVEHSAGWRADLPVALDLLPEAVPPPHARREDREAAEEAAARSVADLLERELVDGGCALVIRNSVARAQRLHELLRGRYREKGEVHLLHGRLAVRDRADRTGECLRLLGPAGVEGAKPRPRRMILVATQLAEQSFDVDADLLVTDLAPVDLLLQRIGRSHRHAGVRRPARLAAPRVVVTGVDAVGSEPPRFPGASEGVYGRYPLLRSAALVRRAIEGSRDGSGDTAWRVPSQVPELVAAGYDPSDDSLPPAWREVAEAARRRWEDTERKRADRAAGSLLTRRGDREGSTLAGLHVAGRAESGGDATVEWLVRDGDPTVEVIVVVREGGVLHTLSGRALSVNGDVPDELLEDLLGGTVRLPSSLTEAAMEELRPLPAWFGHARLRYCPALVLDHGRGTALGKYEVDYDEELGLRQRVLTAG
ncbi:CRISPR-associated helicase Cas3' [Streptomyces alkaliphilus]|uniref:CRISPR-associated helicase Cas3 n=1 Tax=Streptomyces alkaliphilus TaxID=1472722 RepID=A0A7W3Y1Q9_9ACTN|nr:CRISPR-associated helicase Cas3' [Streptomyces alkaliphilus]